MRRVLAAIACAGMLGGAGAPFAAERADAGPPPDPPAPPPAQDRPALADWEREVLAHIELLLDLEVIEDLELLSQLDELSTLAEGETR